MNSLKQEVINELFERVIDNRIQTAENNFDVAETADFSIIYKPKVASSYVNGLLEDNLDNTFTGVFYNFRLNALSTFESHGREEFKLDRTKPLIILYRNPLVKFCSGVLQDFVSEIINRNVLLSDYLASSLHFDYDTVFNTKNHQLMINLLKEPTENVVGLFEKYISLRFKNGTLFESHASCHVDTLLRLLNNKVELTDKDILIDIDSDNTLLRKTIEKLSSNSGQFENKSLKEENSNTIIDHWILWKFILNTNPHFFHSPWWLSICDRLNIEYTGYLELKNKPNNAKTPIL